MITLPACIVVLSPCAGRVRHVAPEGSQVAPGDVVALVDSGRTSTPVVTAAGGRVGGALVGAGHAVTQREGVVWLAR